MPDWRGALRRRAPELRLDPADEAELIEELVQHLDAEFAELVPRVGAAEAERQLLARFDARSLHELGRTRRSVALAPARHDINPPGSRESRRMRTPHRFAPFHFLVVVMLAIGVGATTAVFSVVNGVLLRPLPFHDPGQLVLVGERAPQVPGSDKFAFFDTPSAFLAWQKEATDFQALAAVQNTSFTLTGQGEPRVLDGVRVTSEFFSVLKATPELGRVFVPADAADGGRPMVITDAFWRSAFGADPGIIGRSIGTPGNEARVIGVLPSDFRIGGSELGPMTSGKSTEFFVPFAFGPNWGGNLTGAWTNFNYTAIGRLKPGVTVDAALSRLDVIQARLAADAPDAAPGMTLRGQIMPVLAYATSTSRQELWLLFGAVGAVLLVISVNLGGLWVSQVATRRRDWAIRIALGATPGQLVRRILGEGLVLGLIGGALGTACAALGLKGLLALAPQDIPRLDQVHVDLRVLALGLLLSAAAGLLTALVPALRVGRGDPQESLKAGSRATTAGPAGVRTRQGLIGVQAALTTVLIAVAGLLGFSLYRLMTRPAGFSSDQAVLARVVISSYDDTQRDQILQQITTAVAAIPGVSTTGLTSHPPLEGETWINSAGIPGKQYPRAQQPSVNVRFIGGAYFAAMQIPLLAGRDFRENDRPPGWPPADDSTEARMQQGVIISAAAARLIWPGRDPRSLVGERMLMNSVTTIVGVAADALDGSLTTTAPAVVYRPYWNADPPYVTLVVRTALPLGSIAGSLRAAVRKLAPNAPMSDIEPLGSLRAAATAPQRYQFVLLMIFAGLTLLLAAIGVYALVAHSVAQRRKELAIRLALGAPAGAIRWLIASQAVTPVAWGALAGLLTAIAAGRVLRSMLYQVGPNDPAALGAAAAVVLLAAMLACVLPARRATRVDPNLALRAE
ncbi:MAG TPA: ADOP family duplicated permease [Gemmatimonadales bacterium]